MTYAPAPPKPRAKLPGDYEGITGRIRHRRGWFGRYVLQIEYQPRATHPCWHEYVRRWRDAKADDMYFVPSIIDFRKDPP